MNATLQELKAAALKCTRCGACQSVCPVHERLLTESASARGKLFLLRSLAEDRVAVSDTLARLTETCTLCKACEVRCPSGVKTNELILALRKEMSERGKLPLAKKLAFSAMSYRALFDFSMRFGGLFQGLFFKKTPDGEGATARFPIPAAGLDKRRIIPSFPPKPLHSVLPVRNPAAGGKPKARVAFFPGCMLNYIYVDAGVDLVRVLNAAGVEVYLPDGTGCCGTPAYASGDFAHAAALAEANVNALTGSDFDAVITGCATCGSALSHEYELILDDGPAKDRWRIVKDKIFDFAAFLDRMGAPAPKEVRARVTYHDPCHLARGMKVTAEPRRLIKAVPGVEFKEMKDAAKCCGCAGSFSATHYELSRSINDAKLDNAAATEADILVTGCSACRMHILDGLAQRGSPMQVLHTAQFLARAYLP